MEKILRQQLITWNDPTKRNWLEQFLTVLNSAMADNTEFGRSQGSAIIQGIPTEQYRFRTVAQMCLCFHSLKLWRPRA
jgi:hypothetical protein